MATIISGADLHWPTPSAHFSTSVMICGRWFGQTMAAPARYPVLRRIAADARRISFSTKNVGSVKSLRASSRGYYRQTM
jgi:hypothetical protein